MPRGTYNKTQEHINKIAKANRGKTRSAETRQKISEAAKGRKAWNKGLKLPNQSGINHPFYGKKHTPQTLKKLSELKKGNKNRLGKTFTEESRQKIREAHLGKHYSPATQFKKGQIAPMKGRKRPDIIGNNNPGFKKGSIPWNKGKGTKSSVNELARKTLLARHWREAVFQRDDFTCQDCGIRGYELHAHHIKPFSTHPKLRYDVDNGQTLCIDCHRLTDTWGVKPKPDIQ